MNASEQEQLGRLTARMIKQSSEDLDARLRQLYAEHGAKGILGSGSTIKAAVRIMGDVGSERMASLLDDAGKVSRTEETFELIQAAITEMLNGFGKELPNAIKKATRGGEMGSVGSAALQLFYDVKSDLGADLLIARHGFLIPSPDTRKEARSDRVSKLAGRLPADWWDDLWLEIFRQIHLGDLKPKSQADIVRAMQQWLSDHDVETGDSTLKPRARKLFNMLQKLDD